jgi:hypothetical protein
MEYQQLKLDDSLDVWIVNIGNIHSLPMRLLDILDENERNRCRKLRIEGDRVRFVFAHGILRGALSHKFKWIRSDEWRFLPTSCGKWIPIYPKLENFDFSLSHSATAVAVAVSEGKRVGVDIEEMPGPTKALEVWTVAEACTKMGFEFELGRIPPGVICETREVRFSKSNYQMAVAVQQKVLRFKDFGS